MKRQLFRQPFRALGVLLAAIMLLSLLTTGTVLAHEHGADKTERAASPEKTRQARDSHYEQDEDAAPMDDDPLYLLGSQFGLTPEEVDKFLFMVMLLEMDMLDADMLDADMVDADMLDAEDMDYEKMEYYDEGPFDDAYDAYDPLYDGAPMLMEVVTIKRFYVAGDYGWEALKAGYMDEDAYYDPYGKQAPAMMQRMYGAKEGRYPDRPKAWKMDKGQSPAYLKQEAWERDWGREKRGEYGRARWNRKNAQPEVPVMVVKRLDTDTWSEDADLALELDPEQDELLTELVLALQDPETVQNLLPAVELFWPEIPTMVETMTGMPIEELVEDEEMLEELAYFVEPMLAEALAAGLLPEDMLWTFLTMQE